MKNLLLSMFLLPFSVLIFSSSYADLSACPQNTTDACSSVPESECSSYYLPSSVGDRGTPCTWTGGVCQDVGELPCTTD